MLMHFTLFKQVCALMMIPCLLKYQKSLEGKRPTGLFFNILNVVPYIQLVVGMESVFSIGYENSVSILIDSYSFQGPMFPYLADRGQMLFYACYNYMFKALLLADFMLFSVNLMRCAVSGVCNFTHIMGFLFKRRKAPVRPLQYFISLMLFLVIVPSLVIGKDSLLNTVPVKILGSFIVALLISMIAFVGTAGTQEYQSIPGLLNSVRFGKKANGAEVELEEPERAPDSVKAATAYVKTESPVPLVADVDKDEILDRLREAIGAKLDKYVVEERLYLKRDLTLNNVADKLGVFKDELSDYINFRYNMSFQNYINMLRITYAENYLMSHDHVTQNEIALECGFSGASSFNTAFSRKNGVTPKIWKDRQKELLKNKEA